MLNHLLSSSTGFHGGSEAKESACNAGKPGWSLGREDPLKTEMVTHSGILAWRTPWRQEPCQPQSMGLQRVGRYWETKCSCKEFQVGMDLLFYYSNLDGLRHWVTQKLYVTYFEELPSCFPKGLHLWYFYQQWLMMLHALPSTWCVYLFYYSHPSGGEVVSHCDFDSLKIQNK